jgi:hypothetical protein
MALITIRIFTGFTLIWIDAALRDNVRVITLGSLKFACSKLLCVGVTTSVHSF